MANLLNLIKQPRILRHTDSIRRASSFMYAAEGKSALVSGEDGQLGIINESAIAGFLSQAQDLEQDISKPITDLVIWNIPYLRADTPLKEVARALHETNFDILPVVSEQGRPIGLIFRNDLVGYLSKSIRPPSVAGMATPLGVYLTTGSHSAGAGNLGLFLTGVVLASLITISKLTVNLVDEAVNSYTHHHLEQFLTTHNIPGLGNAYGIYLIFVALLTAIITLSLLRWSPLSGFHAAEHMTVHAMETGEELTPELVAYQPRVHPRCGTNILAAASVFIILTSIAGSDTAILFALLAVFLGWRKIGGMMQHFITTKNPDPDQLNNGVEAGKELITKFMAPPNFQAEGIARIMNMGFIQTAAGMGTALFIYSIIGKILHIPIIM
jgi:hypothetical protein